MHFGTGKRDLSSVRDEVYADAVHATYTGDEVGADVVCIVQIGEEVCMDEMAEKCDLNVITSIVSGLVQRYYEHDVKLALSKLVDNGDLHFIPTTGPVESDMGNPRGFHLCALPHMLPGLACLLVIKSSILEESQKGHERVVN